MRPATTLTLRPCWHLTATSEESGERITLGRWTRWSDAEAARQASEAHGLRLESEQAWHGSDGRWYAVQMRRIIVAQAEI